MLNAVKHLGLTEQGGRQGGKILGFARNDKLGPVMTTLEKPW
jgi:hypothetical protein